MVGRLHGNARFSSDDDSAEEPMDYLDEDEIQELHEHIRRDARPRPPFDWELVGQNNDEEGEEVVVENGIVPVMGEDDFNRLVFGQVHASRPLPAENDPNLSGTWQLSGGKVQLLTADGQFLAESGQLAEKIAQKLVAGKRPISDENDSNLHGKRRKSAEKDQFLTESAPDSADEVEDVEEPFMRKVCDMDNLAKRLERDSIEKDLDDLLEELKKVDRPIRRNDKDMGRGPSGFGIF